MRQCRECHDTGLINLGPINPGGPNVSELCRCQPPQAPLKITNPDDLMDEALDAIAARDQVRVAA